MDDKEPWDSNITRRLLSIDDGNPQKAYYGPCNAILTSIFSSKDGYMVTPQWSYSDMRTDIDPPIEFIVELGLDYEQRPGPRPVMGMQVERAHAYFMMDRRYQADIRARDLVRLMCMHKIQQHPFYVVSMIGTRCCVYTYDTATRTVLPELIRSSDLTAGDQVLTPTTRWSIDIATVEGRRELNSHFDAMKAACKTEADINTSI